MALMVALLSPVPGYRDVGGRSARDFTKGSRPSYHGGEISVKFS
jgi:hypothetical protein